MIAQQAPDVMFVAMPWASTIHPNLGLGLLSAILQEAGISTKILYGNLLMPRPGRPGIYAINDPGQYEDRTAGLAFVTHLFPDADIESIGDAVANRYMGLISRDGHLSFNPRNWDWQRDSGLRDRLLAQTRDDVARAGRCLDRCMNRLSAADFDVVGFSLTFETQLVSSLALARMIKRRWPQRRVLFGGSACTSIQGLTILRAFDFIDVVCLGEGDEIIVDLIKALRTGEDIDGVPGIAYRHGAEVRTTSRLEPMRQLDWLPLPNYDSYFEQKAESEWNDTISVLLFEASRGCWWGEKHLCSFCGLNGESLTYRSKSPSKVLAEIREFCIRWPTNNGLQAVDNIFPMRYFAELLPALSQQQKEHPVGLFFEIKSNLKRKQLFQLAGAGFTTLQPGIETFSDHILKLMDKGATALQQICCLKWSQQVGISATYNILLRNPGETAEDYREMLELIPFLTHLLPPNGIANMQLERYSPYFMRPEAFGIRNIRPKPHYRFMFPDPAIDLNALVYQFDFDHDALDRPELFAARQRLIEAILDWKTNFKPNRLAYYFDANGVRVVDRRGKNDELLELRGSQGEIYRELDEPRTFKYLATRFSPGAPSPLRAFLQRLVRKRVLYYDRASDKYLGVAVRAYVDRAEYLTDMENALMRVPDGGDERPVAASDPSRRSAVVSLGEPKARTLPILPG
jgi:ribosomal peptide maturation radical SAM protein 1